MVRASCPPEPLHLQPDALLRQRLGRSPEVPSSVKGLQRKRKPIVAERENQCQQTQLINPTVALFPSILELFFPYSFIFFSSSCIYCLVVCFCFVFLFQYVNRKWKIKVCKHGIKKLRCWSHVWHETWHHHHPKTSLSLSFPWKDGLWGKPVSLCIPSKFLIQTCVSAALTARLASAELAVMNAGLAGFSLPRQHGCCWGCAPLVAKRTFGMLCFPKSLSITVQLFWHFRNTKFYLCAFTTWNGCLIAFWLHKGP